MISNIVSQSGVLSDVPVVLQNAKKVLDAGFDVTPTTLLSFKAYKSTSFPTIICDKVYIFLYSTDHDSGVGGLYMGKGNNLDCSDFEEVGLIKSGYQAETPFLVSVPEDADGHVVYLFYHTNASDPVNGGIQQTRLITTTGGNLINSIWVDRGKPLGVQPTEDHTGYLAVWRLGESNYRGIHVIRGGGSVAYASSTASNPRTWTRDYTYDLLQGIQDDFEAKPSYGEYFYMYGRWWFIGTIEPITSENGISVDKSLIIAKANSNFQITEQILELNTDTRNYTCMIINKKAYLHYNTVKTELWYGTVDLTGLHKYL